MFFFMEANVVGRRCVF